jgi:predicted lipoprotein with Yx(FWY)xxD motif
MVVVGANATAAGATAKATKSVIVSTATIANVGKVLQSGKTLYTLKETKPCTSACLKIWPALLLPKGDKKAKAGPGVIASKLGSVAVSGGLRQVTYGGKALYLFVGDTSAATVNGNVSDEWGTWAPVVTKKASTSSAGSGGTAASTGGSAF